MDFYCSIAFYMVWNDGKTSDRCSWPSHDSILDSQGSSSTTTTGYFPKPISLMDIPRINIPTSTNIRLSSHHKPCQTLSPLYPMVGRKQLGELDSTNIISSSYSSSPFLWYFSALYLDTIRLGLIKLFPSGASTRKTTTLYSWVCTVGYSYWYSLSCFTG